MSTIFVNEFEHSQRTKRARSLVGTSDGRPEDDFYRTPPEATNSLLHLETFTGTIWEPACGDGAISSILSERGYSVISTDLNYRGYGEGSHDFFSSPYRAENIVTNPPYKFAEKFVRHSLSLTTGKVAMLLKLQFLEGMKRKALFAETPLKTVYVFSKRLTMYRNGDGERYSSGMIAFAWFVWEHGYHGAPSLSWI